MEPLPQSGTTPDQPEPELPPHQPGHVVGPSHAPPAAEASASQLPNPFTDEAISSSSPQVIEQSFTPPSPTVPETDRPLGVAGASAGIVNGGQIFGHNDQAPSKSRKLLPKKLAIPIAAFLVLLGGSAAAYFGYYAPNQPDNIWKIALSRTGQGYDKLTDYINQQATAKNKGTAVKGSFKFSGAFAADGSLTGSSDGSNGEYTGSLSAAGLKLSLDLRTLKSTGTAPDLYFKVDGLQGLGDLLGGGDPTITNTLNGVDGNWYFVDHSLFDQISGSSVSDMQFTSADINDTLKAIDGPSRTYIFNDDPQKEIFTLKQKIGKEKQDGRNVYHYKVALNKDNLKAYDGALCDSLKDTKLFKLIANGDIDGTLKSCKDTSDLDRVNDSSTADVWVDTHTKLVHRVRITDKTNPSSYFDIGQDYQGGDKLPFFVDIYDKSDGTTTKGHIAITLDMKANSLDINGNFSETGSDSSSNESGTFDISVGANNSPVTVEKPATSKNVIQLLDDLGIGQLFSGLDSGGSASINSGIQSEAKDTERKTDINALHGQIEAYETVNGFYPTLANINDPNWRAANMKGLDDQALQDPDGTSPKLVAAPAAHIYAYQASPAGCNDTTVQCTDYTLSATLDAGGTYVKQALDSPGGNVPLYQD